MRLETDRLYIRLLTEADWPEMRNIFVDFHDSKYAIYEAPFPIDEDGTRELTKAFVVSNCFFAVFLKDTNGMLGYLCFHNTENVYDIGYCFHSAYHSKGYAYEAVKAFIEYLVQEVGVTYFTAGTAIDNAPSCRLLEKLGFTCVSTQPLSFDNVFFFQSGNFVLNIEER